MIMIPSYRTQPSGATEGAAGLAGLLIPFLLVACSASPHAPTPALRAAIDDEAAHAPNVLVDVAFHGNAAARTCTAGTGQVQIT